MTQAVFLLKQGADPNVEYNSTALDIKRNEFPIKLAFTTLKVAKFYIKAKPVKKSESLKIFASSKSVNFADKEGNVADVTIHP